VARGRVKYGLDGRDLRYALAMTRSSISDTYAHAVDRLEIPRVGAPGRSVPVDALRGLAILLVVLGHSISNAENLYNVAAGNPRYILSNFLYTFHMPLFMFVAGFVLFGRKIRLGDRAIRLLVPFLAWIPVYWFVNRYIRHFPWPVRFWTTFRETLLQPGAGLWFLPTLFICSMLLIPAVLLEKRESWAGEVYLAAIFIAINLVPYDRLGLVQVKYFFAFFAIGYLVAKHKDAIRSIARNRLNAGMVACSVVFVLMFGILYYYGKVNPFTFPFTLANIYKTPGAFVIRYGMALLGIVFAISFITALGDTRARTFFAWFGLVTMDIYVAHGLMLQLTFGSPWVKIIVSMVTGTVLPLALSFLILRRTQVTAMLFYGIKPTEIEPPARTDTTSPPAG
jgi:fucose 4-O-acetylase-like acetyltransferase